MTNSYFIKAIYLEPLNVYLNPDLSIYFAITSLNLFTYYLEDFKKALTELIKENIISEYLIDLEYLIENTFSETPNKDFKIKVKTVRKENTLTLLIGSSKDYSVIEPTTKIIQRDYLNLTRFLKERITNQ